MFRPISVEVGGVIVTLFDGVHFRAGEMIVCKVHSLASN